MSEYNNFFNNKVVIITGSASGVGQTIAEEFAKLNSKIVIVDQDLENTIKVCKRFRSYSPNDYTPLQIIADLANTEDIHRIIGETVSKFGKIDILVNNAGIEPTTQSSEHPSALELFDKVIAINLRASFQLCNLAFKHLSQTKGSIINVSAISNLRTSSNFNTSYSISKSGIDALTRNLSVEWSRYGIRVNSVNLGHISTPTLDEGIPRLLLQKLYPIGRYGRPIDVANAVLFLSSEKANFITGINLPIDGGYSNIDGLTGANIAKQQMMSNNFSNI